MTDTKHSAELATCDFCRASEVPVRRKYLRRANKERQIGDGFTITRYCQECGLEGKPDTKHTPKDTNSPDSISTAKDVYQHTDSVEAIILEASNRLARFEYEPAKWHNMMVYEASDLEGFLDWLRATLQAHTSQQVEEAVLQADATGAYHSGYLAGKAEVEEAVRKERERIEEQVLTPLYEKIDKWFQEKHDIIGQGALAAVFEEALQAITPNHQD